MSTSQRGILLIVLLAGLGAAAYVGVLRIFGEQANYTVAVAVDYDDVRRAASLVGKTPQALLTDLKAAGATHVAITEVTLGELAETNKLLSATPARIIPVISLSAQARQRVIHQVEAKLPPLSAESYRRYGQLRDISPRLRDLGVGYDEGVEVAQAAGLKIIARPRPDFVSTAQAVDASINAAKEIGAEAVVFAGTRVLGYKSLLEYVADKLQAKRLQFGLIELAAQDGEHALARHLDYEFVRVHSISEQELVGMSPQRAVDRLSLAVRERKVRLCYLHLFFTHGDPVATNADYLQSLTRRLRADGFTPGSPRPFAVVTTPDWALAVIFAALGAALMWLIQPIIGLSGRAFWLITALLFALGAVGGLIAGDIARPLAALLAALIFPIWALLTTRFRERPAARPVLAGVGTFLRISVITAAGGLLVAGCLTETSYLVKIQQFRGVKLAELFPLLVIAAILAARSMPHYWEVRTELGEDSREEPALRAGLGQAFSCVVRYWHALVVILALAIVAILLLRSGNEPGLGISGVEMKVRALLDQVLVVRPRSKEVFFAHPLMMVSLILLAYGARRGLWVGLTAGAIGQVSLMNTFCHLHTPLLVSLLRVANGLWLGIVGGLVLWVIVQGIGKMNRQMPPGSRE